MNLESVQYKIPQNVGIEDRIVGPLTLRQLIILAVGFGTSYVLFSVLSKLYELNILEYIIIILPALFAAAFALIKINDIRLTKFVVLFLEFALKPKKRVWDHRGIASLVSPDLEGQKKETEELTSHLEEKAKKATNLKELSQILDSGGFEHIKKIEHGEIDDVHDDDLMSQAYFGHKDSSTENMYWRTKESHIKMLDIFAKLPITKIKKGSKEAELMRKKIEEIKQETEAMKKKPLSVPQTAQAVMNQPVTEKPRKKPRRRKHNIPKPIRSGNRVNTTAKNQPARYIPKAQPKKEPFPAKPTKTTAPETKKAKEVKKDGEFKFEELKKGEIEINLD